MRILGIDPGLDATGYGMIELEDWNHPHLVEAGLIRTRPGRPLSERLGLVAQEVQTILSQFHPETIAVEDLYSYYKTPEPAILMGHVRGVILSQAALAGVSVTSYLPTRVKRAVVGQGHAPKGQLARMVLMRLNLRENQIPPDVSDALAVALCHAASIFNGVRPHLKRGLTPSGVVL